MSRLALRLFGAFQLTLDGTPVTQVYSDRVRALLAYLATEGDRPHRREELAELLFSEGAASSGLRVAIFHLRQLLGPLAPSLLLAERRSLALCTTDPAFWSDVATFDELLFAAGSHQHTDLRRCSACLRRLAEAVALYQGDLLAGLSLADSPAFEEWRVHAQERRHQQALAALEALAAHHLELGDPAVAADYARRAVAIEPWHEIAHRQLMRALAAAGRRPAALEQYERCRELLRQHLGVEPAPETEVLATELRAQEARPATPASPQRSPLWSGSGPAPGRALSQRYLTPLIGRERELRQLERWLGDPAHRIVSLVGEGGVGKTRMALAAADLTAHRFREGVTLAALAGVDGSGRPAEALAVALVGALGLGAQVASRPAELLREHLAGRELLLVLDNLEHLLYARGGLSEEIVELLLDLLGHAPRLHLLITSRMPLDLQAESVLRLEGLPAPPAEGGEDGAGYSAVQLFLERATRRVHTLAPDGEGLAAIGQICRLVAGLPLAIELAAAQAAQRTIGEIAAAVSSDLAVLATSMQDVPERHRSLRAVCNESWALLSPAEQRVFSRLAVFRGGFDLDAAAEVAGASPAQLSALFGHSLLRREGEGRYSLHEMLRHYAAGHLRASPAEQADAELRHARHYADLLDTQRPLLEGSRQRDGLDRIARDLNNIHAAWEYALAMDRPLDPELIASYSEALWLFYDRQALAHEGVARFSAAIQRYEAAPDLWQRRDLLRVFGRLLALRAFLGRYLGDFAGAWMLAEHSIAALRAADAPSELAWSLHLLGGIAWQRGELDVAQATLDEALEIYAAIGNRQEWAKSLTVLAGVAHDRGDSSPALALTESALPFLRASAEPKALTFALLTLGQAQLARGALEAARASFEEVLEIARVWGNRSVTAGALAQLGQTLRRLGGAQRAEAARLLQESIELYEEVRAPWNTLDPLNQLGEIALEAGDMAKARTYFRSALALAIRTGVKPRALESVIGLAQALAEGATVQRAAGLAALVREHPAASAMLRERAAALASKLPPPSSIPSLEQAAAEEGAS